MDLLYNLACAFVGFEAAVSVKDFVEKYEWQVTIEDLLDKGQFDKVEKWGINDHSAMIEKMQASDLFAEALSDERMANLATYFVMLPSEVAMKLWTVVGDNECVDNCIKLHKATAADGTSVSEHLVKILGG